jgi:hypothetical protein
MEDFHDSARHASEALAAAASVEAEARATGGGPPRRARRLHRHQLEEDLWCAGRDSLLGVRRPPDVRVRESVKLPDEVLVRPLRLLVGVRGLHTNQM